MKEKYLIENGMRHTCHTVFLNPHA